MGAFSGARAAIRIRGIPYLGKDLLRLSEARLGGRTEGLPIRKQRNRLGCDWLVGWLVESRANLQRKAGKSQSTICGLPCNISPEDMWIPTAGSSAARPRDACKKFSYTKEFDFWEINRGRWSCIAREDYKAKGIAGSSRVASQWHFPKPEFLQIWRLVGGGWWSLLVSASPENPPLRETAFD